MSIKDGYWEKCKECGEPVYLQRGYTDVFVRCSCDKIMEIGKTKPIRKLSQIKEKNQKESGEE